MRILRLALIAICACLVLPSAALAEEAPATESPVGVGSEALDFAPFSSETKEFGKLEWRGGVRVSSEDKRFGGFSGLAVSRDGARMVAVSDRGWWLAAKFVRDGGKLAGLKDAKMAPILGSDGRWPKSHTRRDAESLSAWDERGLDGRLMVGFEQRARIETFDVGKSGLAALPKLVLSPMAIADGPNNQEFEALGRFVDGPRMGSIVVISEADLDEGGNIKSWIWNDSLTEPFAVKRHSDYLITDLAILPGGEELVTVERSFSLPLPPGMAVRRFKVADLKAGAAPEGEVLFEGRRPLYAIDNMEAIAAHRAADGRVILTLMSDDNYFRSIQSTILIEFAIAPLVP